MAAHLTDGETEQQLREPRLGQPRSRERPGAQSMPSPDRSPLEGSGLLGEMAGPGLGVGSAKRVGTVCLRRHFRGAGAQAPARRLPLAERWATWAWK